MDENLAKVQKDYIKSQEQCSKLQRDLRENVAQKEDQVKQPTNPLTFKLIWIKITI